MSIVRCHDSRVRSFQDSGVRIPALLMTTSSRPYAAMVASTIAGEAGIEIPSIPSVPAFGEFEFPTLTADSTMLDIVGTPADLEGIAACSALWVPGNVETCTTAYTEGLTAYSEYLQGVAQLPVADVLAIEGLDYSAFVDGYTQMIEAWTPAMAGATFSG